MNLSAHLRSAVPSPVRRRLSSVWNLGAGSLRRWVRLFEREPRRRTVTWHGRTVMAQEYAGRTLLYSEGTSLISHLRTARDVYEPDLMRRLWREIDARRASVFLDVGANIGLIALAVLKRFPRLRIEAFEPGPHQGELLRATVEYNHLQTKIGLHTIALADMTGEKDFFVHATEHASGDGFVDTGRAGPSTKIRVPVQRLDDWWEQAGEPDARVVKIDTEGAELLVLKGGTRLLSHCRPTLFIEIWPDNLVNYPWSPGDVHEWLQTHEYTLETLHGTPVCPQAPAFRWDQESMYIARPCTRP